MTINSELISESLRIRRSAHQFLVGYAPLWFALQEEFTGPMLVPPSLPVGPDAEPMERSVALAADEAERLGHAELITLDPGATVAATSYGARLQASAAVDALAGHGTIAGHGIVPPATAGFLRWATPITRGADEAPITGVHWGRVTTPETSGVWLAFWGDLSGLFVRGLADIAAPHWFTPQLANDMLTEHLPIYYDESFFLQERDMPLGPGATPDPAPATFPFTMLRFLPLTTLPAELPADRLDPDPTLAYIVLASWAMLTPDPDEPTRPPHLARLPVSAQEAEADRQAGLPPARHVTVVSAPTLRTTDPLPEGVDDDLNHLRMRIVALVAPDAPDGPSPDEVIADLLGRYEPEVAMMASYHASQQVLHALTVKTGTTHKKALTQILRTFAPGTGKPFDDRAWPALRHLLLAQHQEPTLPPPEIAPADLLWALGTFQACALMRLAGNEHRSDRSKHKPATRPPTKRARKKRR
ncbi:hypothetical protein [Actinomadura chibensis]|uniref:Uncharacterized protein n=1 Tax=Actinomadura chibensis TaxID=392828 RepID=A0A5D0NHN8_9ACTN|nr:hypothetical protein [Actinomadura chibensis]TYB43882.1 hypothetical protein FXF69_23200 [Actinomadura chibensis]